MSVPLTEDQRRAGRDFRDACQAELDKLNGAEPADGNASPLWRVVRHPCQARNGASAGIVLREHYSLSPRFMRCYCGATAPVANDFPHDDCDGGTEIAAAGLLAFIWKDGRCDGCGLTVCSRTGRVVLAAFRPPEKVRVVSSG